ncbi:aromatic motif membrane protein [Mycoplasmopsis gallopavonis]|uniref:Lipoprotein n=1 Tax=Mycoplasmopsis gallopavonis TaxID=76629 RepID=A0A449B064_9BACT|nr:aromatic motif membrane protein [Mycoplasmopsis gallopavonis]VEU73115.1 Uncharacterised protein [Mycoplasmopsis gallopavonis]
MKNKLLNILTFSSIPLAFTSCANYQTNSQYDKFIDHKLDVNTTVLNKDTQRTQKILNFLLKEVFKDNEVERLNFITNQSNPDIINNFKNLQAKYQEIFKAKEGLKQEIADLNKKIDWYKFLIGQYWNELQEAQAQLIALNDQNENYNEKEKDYLTQFGNLISDNWYFFLTNLDKFHYEFFQYIGQTFADKDFISRDYINSLKTKKPTTAFNLYDNNLNELILGEETRELQNANIYYLNKDKLVFRITIANINSNNPVLKIDPYIWYFENLKAQKISLNLISSIYHFAFIHNYPQSYDQFIIDMVQKQRYGEPAYLLITAKENNNEEIS